MRRLPTAYRKQYAEILGALRDLMLGGRHNRHTLVRQFHISLPTADRWLQAFLTIPGVRTFKVVKTRWYEWGMPPKILTPEQRVLKEAVAWWNAIVEAKPNDDEADETALLDAIEALTPSRRSSLLKQ